MELDERVVVGVKVKLKKAHPCGKDNKIFTIFYIGNRIELQCIECQHRFFLDRESFLEKLVEII